MKKPRVAIFDFAGCEGCQLQIVNLEEELLSLIEIVDVVEWREGMSEKNPKFDIALIEGSITRPEDEERLRDIRARAKVLVTIGACAGTGGVNKLRNHMDQKVVGRTVYGADADKSFLQVGTVRAIDEVVPVDLQIPGCPIDGREFTRVVRTLVLGGEPHLPEHPVCVECKRANNVCRYEYGEVCLGPITRAGCGARCPSFGMWCFGCRGKVTDPNVDAAHTVMASYGKTVEELEQRLALFGS